MIYKIDYIIAFLSSIFTLEEGDIIYTGTPEGVGKVMAGDVIEAEIPGVGKLRHTVVSAHSQFSKGFVVMIVAQIFFSFSDHCRGRCRSSLLLLSFAYRPPVNNEAPRASSVESLYAPFDSIRTDIEDYIWPINAPPKITSSFAEFRSSHFHAGIDIGTGNRIGVEVYASRDGYIARVEVSPYGYGRYLVLRHADGFYTTYAHLSAFKNELERAVRAEQLKTGKFSVEMKFQPGEYPVRKGDVVAYSGESGTGDAHLHFEIRDENFNPVNPLLFPNIRRFTDTEPPIIRRLAITPMDEHSFVDYEFSPKVYRAHARSRSSYTVPEVIRATGSLGFSVDAADRVNNTRYRSSVYEFEFQVDGTTIFTSQRNRFPEDETRQVGIDFDWALWKERKGRFQKLYVDEGNTLPFYNRRNQFDGVVALKNFSEGLHKFKVIASDYSGNSSELTGTFVLNHPPEVEILNATSESVTAFLPNRRNVASVEIGPGRFHPNDGTCKNTMHARWHGTKILCPYPVISREPISFVLLQKIFGERGRFRSIIFSNVLLFPELLNCQATLMVRF